MRQPEWKMQPDGSRVRLSNGITIIDRSARGAAAAGAPSDIEHLITWRQAEGEVVILGLDEDCRPIYATTLPPPGADLGRGGGGGRRRGDHSSRGRHWVTQPRSLGKP